MVTVYQNCMPQNNFFVFSQTEQDTIKDELEGMFNKEIFQMDT